jgi:hypothetical protein
MDVERNLYYQLETTRHRSELRRVGLPECHGTHINDHRSPEFLQIVFPLPCCWICDLLTHCRQVYHYSMYLAHASNLFACQVCSHKPAIVPYVLAAGTIYGIDHLTRLVKLRICTARIKPLPELETTNVQILTLNTGWRAGQHVRLRVLSSRMGWWGWTENHPFTIASMSDTEDGLILMCKQSGTVGSWTARLYDLAKASGYAHGRSGKMTVGRNVKVMIEGPYGTYAVVYKFLVLCKVDLF